MIETIYAGTKTLAIIIRVSFNQEGIHFFTPNDFSQQLAYMKRPAGYVIQPHIHNSVPREVMYTKEVLFIKSGMVRVDFYDDEKTYLESTVLMQGDVILLAFGGHGFHMIEEAEIIEVKQGPYAGEQDKSRFDTVANELIKIRGTNDSGQ
jgi:mannose-6-phosphate isomerase-like protein (cupin superfamily)